MNRPTIAEFVESGNCAPNVRREQHTPPTVTQLDEPYGSRRAQYANCR